MLGNVGPAPAHQKRFASHVYVSTTSLPACAWPRMSGSSANTKSDGPPAFPALFPSRGFPDRARAVRTTVRSMRRVGVQFACRSRRAVIDVPVQRTASGRRSRSAVSVGAWNGTVERSGRSAS